MRFELQIRVLNIADTMKMPSGTESSNVFAHLNGSEDGFFREAVRRRKLYRSYGLRLLDPRSRRLPCRIGLRLVQQGFMMVWVLEWLVGGGSCSNERSVSEFI